MSRVILGIGAVTLLTLVISLNGQAQEGEEAGQDLLKALEAMSLEMEKMQSGKTDPPPEMVMIDAPGEYPYGRYTGRCESKLKPANPAIGDRYEVRHIASDFFRQREDGSWYGVGGNSPDPGAPEYVCAAKGDKVTGHFLGAKYKGNIRGPGRYELRVKGYVEWYEVKECITVGGGACPERVSREEIDYEIPFTVLAQP